MTRNLVRAICVAGILAAATTARAQGFVAIGGPGFGVPVGPWYGGFAGPGFGVPVAPWYGGFAGPVYGPGFPAFGVAAAPVPVAQPVVMRPAPVMRPVVMRPGVGFGYPAFYGPRPFGYGGFRPVYGPGFYRRW